MSQVVNCVGDLPQLVIQTLMEIVDSTPLEDPGDPDARKGKTSKGWVPSHFQIRQNLVEVVDYSSFREPGYFP